MDVGLVVIFAILLLWFAIAASAIAGSVDTFQFAPEVWAEAGYLRTNWIWQAALVPFLPGVLVYSGVYFVRVRPRLRAAERAFEASDPDYLNWTERRHWYDRLSRARRSPYEWEKAARRWWQWIPAALFSLAFAAFWFYGAASHNPIGSVATSYLLAAGLSVSGLLDAARAGFWYGERMRLTGRRPERGGALARSGPTVTANAIKTKQR